MDLPEAKIDALIADGTDAILVSPRHKPILRCTVDACTEIAPALSEPVLAMGRLITGELWVLEQKGTLLVDDGTSNVPEPWYDFTERRVQFSSFVQLYVNPWLRPRTEVEFQFLKSPVNNNIWYFIGLSVVGICVLFRKNMLRIVRRH